MVPQKRQERSVSADSCVLIIVQLHESRPLIFHLLSIKRDACLSPESSTCPAHYFLCHCCVSPSSVLSSCTFILLLLLLRAIGWQYGTHFGCLPQLCRYCGPPCSGGRKQGSQGQSMFRLLTPTHATPTKQ